MKFILALCSIIFALLCLAQVQAVEKSACSLPKVIGPCRGSDLSYYYDTDAKACQQFLYGGCQGNDNRFHVKEDCEKLCVE